MKLLIQLMFLWLIWLASPRRRRRLLTGLLAVVAVVLVSLSSWGIQLALWGLTVWLPPDTGESADTIVVLGRGEAFRDLRTGAAQELWQAQRAPSIFASGMMDARSIVQSLKGLGVPGQNLSGEECSRSTQENALFTAALIQSRGAEQILLVTDTAHMLRSLLVFRRNGFQVIPHTVSLPPEFSLLDQQRCLLREYLALLQYILTSRRANALPSSSATTSAGVMKEATERVQDWNCWVRGAA